MKTVTLKLVSKQDMESYVNERVKAETQHIYECLNKLREQQNDLEIMVKHFLGAKK